MIKVRNICVPMMKGVEVVGFGPVQREINVKVVIQICYGHTLFRYRIADGNALRQ